MVWDGPGVREVKIAWRALSGGKTFAKGAEALTLNPGDIRFIPFSFEVPQVAGRTEGAVEMRLSGAGVADVTDRLPLEFRPASRLPAKGVKIQLLDPRGKSRPWLEKLGAECVPLAEGTKPDPALPLVIGREALSELRKLPFAPADVEAGLRVLFLSSSRRLGALGVSVDRNDAPLCVPTQFLRTVVRRHGAGRLHQLARHTGPAA